MTKASSLSTKELIDLRNRIREESIKADQMGDCARFAELTKGYNQVTNELDRRN